MERLTLLRACMRARLEASRPCLHGERERREGLIEEKSPRWPASQRKRQHPLDVEAPTRGAYVGGRWGRGRADRWRRSPSLPRAEATQTRPTGRSRCRGIVMRPASVPSPPARVGVAGYQAAQRRSHPVLKGPRNAGASVVALLLPTPCNKSLCSTPGSRRPRRWPSPDAEQPASQT